MIRGGVSKRFAPRSSVIPAARGAPFPLADYRKRLARGLLKLGRPAEAREALDALRGSDGAGGLDREAEWLLSRAWLQEGKLEEAASALSFAGSYRSENPLDPEPSPYVGGARCVSCHREVSRSHDLSRHARTFHHGRDLLDLPFPDRPLADPGDAKITHAFKRENDKIKVETRAGDKVYQLIVEYAFGTSDRYVTMVGRDEATDVSSSEAFFLSHEGRDGLGSQRGRRAGFRREREQAGASPFECETESCAACTVTPRFIVRFEIRDRSRLARRPPTGGSAASVATAPAATTSRRSKATSRRARS